MGVEIERKFLVKSNFKKFAVKSYKIAQGFLSSNPERTVRVRIRDTQGFITVKGKGNSSGTTRFEWEKEISLSEAEALLQLCESGIIDKIRYEIPLGKHTFEVDVFSGENQGLIIAEVELTSENEFFEQPNWLGKEVTGDKKYYNSHLSEHPFCSWK